jgi:hypothetical protein
MEKVLAGLFAAAVGAMPTTALADHFEAKVMCECKVTGLSADGSAAVGTFTSEDDHGEPWLWTVGRGLRRLGRQPVGLKTLRDAPAISANGRAVAATILAESGTHAVQGLWREGQGWQELGPLPGDAVVFEGAVSHVIGMSPDASVVVGAYGRVGTFGLMHSAARWSSSDGVDDFGHDSPTSRLYGASRGGQVMVGEAWPPARYVYHAAVWDKAGKIAWLERVRPSHAAAVNADGNVIAGTKVDDSQSDSVAMLWRKVGEQWVGQELGRPRGFQDGVEATGLSGDGRTVVGRGNRYEGCWVSCDGGWVWTAETGILPAHEFFRGAGFGVDRQYRIREEAAVSHDGKVFAVVANHRDGAEPDLSFIVRRVPSTGPWRRVPRVLAGSAYR